MLGVECRYGQGGELHNGLSFEERINVEYPATCVGRGWNKTCGKGLPYFFANEQPQSRLALVGCSLDTFSLGAFFLAVPTRCQNSGPGPAKPTDAMPIARIVVVIKREVFMIGIFDGETREMRGCREEIHRRGPNPSHYMSGQRTTGGADSNFEGFWLEKCII